jgi:hypothetical protein
MKEGLLWYDNDPQRKLTEKVKQAAQCYQSRLRRKPTVCYINAAEFDTEVDQINGIHLRPATNVLPHHFFVGVEQDSLPAKAA